MAYVYHHHDNHLQTRKSIVSDLIEQAVDLLRRGLAEWRIWRRRSRERAELRGMSERELSDIGLSRGDVFYESAKPMWRE